MTLFSTNATAGPRGANTRAKIQSEALQALQAMRETLGTKAWLDQVN